MDLKLATASQEILLGPFLDDDDGVTQKTGLTIANTDIKIFKAGGTTLGNKNSGGATEIATGFYYATLDATDTDTLGPLVIVVQMTDCLCVRHEFNVVSAAYYDWVYGSTKPDVNTYSITNDAITAAAIQNGAIDAATFAANAITSTVIADDAITAAKLNTGAITADAFAADAIVAATLATGAITADAFAADAIVAATLATGALTADAFAANAITNAAVADDVDVNVKTMTAGVITSTVLADDCITAAKLNTDAIAADAFAQTAADKVWSTEARVLTANTNLSILDAAATAAAVWDAVASSYDDASSMGALLNDAGAAGDPWATAIPGAYGAGTAGLLLGTTIPNAIDAVDNYVDTELAAVKTVVDAVKLKTDNIPASPAAVGSAMTISSSAITAGVFAAGAITADVIANAAIDQATFAADVYVTCDVKKVNGTTLTGDGGATPWGPA